MRQVTIKTTRRCQLLDVTDQVSRLVKEEGEKASAVLVAAPHTTAGVIINERADPSVAEDILEYLDKLVPQSHSYRHPEGNSDAHIKSAIAGCSILIPINQGKLVLGTWQGVFFAEFDGPRARKLNISLLA
jgi:secondary thiamine-phosphate synthase enzyme